VDKSDAAGRLKVNPLIDWDAARIAAWFADHDLPAHPLVAQGYPPSAARPAPARSPRRRPPLRALARLGQDRVRIHVAGKDDDLPPGYEPAF
jgi:phosphoadenosine phosphosulfate reductase